MNNIESLQAVLAKEVSRREFLFQIGGAFVALIGISSMIKNLSQLGATKPTPRPSNNDGAYGWEGYSGFVPAQNNSMVKTR